MIDGKKILAACDQIDAALDSGKLTEAMIQNAMANLDRATPSFGKAATEWQRVATVTGNTHTTHPYTAQDLREFVANKRAMFAAHPHLVK
jgi:hypothetical protein